MFAPRPVSLAIGAALALGAAPRLPAQAFEGVVGMRLRSVSNEIQVYLKGGKTRIEMESPAGSVAILADPTAGEQYLVMPAQKMYMVMKTEDAKAMADSLVKSKLGAEATLTATGRIDRVAGRECEIYRAVSEKSVRDICVAKGMGPLEAFSTLLNPMGGMGPMGRPGGKSPGNSPWARELARLKGFPLRIADTVGVAEWEITRMERKSLDAAMFSPPADFQRMDMPGRKPPLE